MMRKIIVCAILIASAAGLALSQNQTASNEFRKAEVFAGYSAANLIDGNPENVVDAGSNSTPTYRGWNVSAVYNFNRYLGIKADVSGHYKKFTLLETPVRVRANGSVYNFAAGIQLKDNKKTKRFSPFLHALAGVGTSKIRVDFAGLSNLSDSNTGFSMVFGGGLDLRVGKRFSIRLIQVDYNPTFAAGSTQNNVRLGFGIVFH